MLLMARNRLLLLGALLPLALACGCHSGQVRMQLAPGLERYQWRDPLPEDAFSPVCSPLFYVMEPPLGYAAARHQPLEGFALSAKVRWNEAVRTLCQHLSMLCRQHNSAALTVQEFRQRRRLLLELAGEFAQRKQRLDALLARYQAALKTLAALRAEQGEAARSELVKARAAAATARAEADRIIEGVRERLGKLAGPRSGELIVTPGRSETPARKPGPPQPGTTL